MRHGFVRAVRACGALFWIGSVVSCGNDATGPSAERARLEVFAGENQFGLPGQVVAEPLEVFVSGVTSGTPLEDIPVEWKVLQGSGVTITPLAASSDETGVVGARVTLGSEIGTATIEATIGTGTDQRVQFSVHAVRRPQIDAVSPLPVVAGEIVTIAGVDFSTASADNAVRFGAFRGAVESATPTELRVRAPICLPGRTVNLRVSLGAIESAAVPVSTVASNVPDLELQPGAGFIAASAADLDCIRLPFADGASYLVVPQSVAASFVPDLPLELRGVGAGGLVTVPPTTARRPQTPEDWEIALRRREHAFEGAFVPPSRADRPLAVAVPQIGDRRQFRVLTDPGAGSDATERIEAEVKYVSDQAVIYQDLDAPAAGLTTQDFAELGELFDDPIYSTVTGAYGQPSDIDANERVVILFTPRVNGLTPRGQGSFIVGYFYGCDLVPASRCAETNRAEIFYSLVPDPDARFGDARTRPQVMSTIPGVLAHEFQHMISFVERNQTLDALWLSEALAHTAEDLVGDVFAARGDATRAEQFRFQNYNRARRYLAATAATSIIGETGTGTLELRGGAWLLVKYLMGHYGGTDLLGQLTRNDEKGVANITTVTGQPWRLLLGEFAVALWADGAPELNGTPLASPFTFPNFDPRDALNDESSGFPLVPTVRAAGDFGLDLLLPPASHAFTILRHTSGTPLPPPLHMTMTRANGGAFAPSERPSLVILRIR